MKQTLKPRRASSELRERRRTVPANGHRSQTGAAKGSPRRELREWRASLPTQLERDTLLMPDAIAESVVQEVERYLDARLPDGFADRLAARAHHLYPRHRHFRQTLQRPGNNGRENLSMFMRHWTCGWLKRERSVLYKRLPWSFAQGQPLRAPMR